MSKLAVEMSESISVCPYYFTSRPLEMCKFLEFIGLKLLVERGDGYAILGSGSGFVAVHGTPAEFGISGETHLVLIVPNADKFVEEMAGSGLDIQLWDEAWGKQAGVVCPLGGGIWINELQHDSYGYKAAEAMDERKKNSAVLPKVEVVMVRYSPDFAADREFFQKLGFISQSGADEWWEQLQAGKSSGWIGLHKADAGQVAVREDCNNPLNGMVPVVSLSFQTDEALPNLAARLQDAGYKAQMVSDSAATKVHVEDPEGNHLEIHPIGELSN